jgi:hypothetical protein
MYKLFMINDSVLWLSCLSFYYLIKHDYYNRSVNVMADIFTKWIILNLVYGWKQPETCLNHEP